MTDDIVARLLFRADYAVYPSDAEAFRDAANAIGRLRAERDAIRAELSDALVLTAQHLDCFRTERWELGNVMRERDALRELLRDAYHTWGEWPQETLARIDAALNKGWTNE